jgi:hypothetical protein
MPIGIVLVCMPALYFAVRCFVEVSAGWRRAPFILSQEAQLADTQKWATFHAVMAVIGAAVLVPATQGIFPFVASAISCVIAHINRDPRPIVPLLLPLVAFCATMLAVLRSNSNIADYINSSDLDIASTTSWAAFMHIGAFALLQTATSHTYYHSIVPENRVTLTNTALAFTVVAGFVAIGATWAASGAVAGLLLLGALLRTRSARAILVIIPPFAVVLAAIASAWLTPRSSPPSQSGSSQVVLDGPGFLLIGVGAGCGALIAAITWHFGAGVWDLPDDAPWKQCPPQEGARVSC